MNKTKNSWDKQTLAYSLLVQAILSNLQGNVIGKRVSKKLMRELKRGTSTYAKTLKQNEFVKILQACNSSITNVGRTAVEQGTLSNNEIDPYVFVTKMIVEDKLIAESFVRDSTLDEFKETFYAKNFKLSSNSIRYIGLLTADINYYLKYNHDNI